MHYDIFLEMAKSDHRPLGTWHGGGPVIGTLDSIREERVGE